MQAQGEFTKALVMGFRLGEQELLGEVIEAIPQARVQLVAKTFPEAYLEKLLALLAEKLRDSYVPCHFWGTVSCWALPLTSQPIPRASCVVCP